jgi:hypothetical protein
MSYKSAKLSPLSTQGSNLKFAIRGPWSTPPASLRDIQFLQSWLEYDSHADRDVAPGHINWGAIGGLVLVAAISASFWTGLGLAVVRVLR